MENKELILVRDRLEKLTIVNSVTGCWERLGLKEGTYPYIFNEFGIYERANRFSYRYYVGTFSPILHVLHNCDNRICINPSHLFLGTNTDNTKDRDDKKRTAIGLANGKAFLSDDAINTIKILYGTGLYTQKQLAKKFKCHTQYIWKIINNKVRIGT